MITKLEWKVKELAKEITGNSDIMSGVASTKNMIKEIRDVGSNNTLPKGNSNQINHAYNNNQTYNNTPLASTNSKQINRVDSEVLLPKNLFNTN